MNFKKGDIVTPKGDHEDIIFKISSVRWDNHYGVWGIKSKDKSWLACGQHIGKMYRGTYVSEFHLGNDLFVHYNPLIIKMKLKPFKL